MKQKSTKDLSPSTPTTEPPKERRRREPNSLLLAGTWMIALSLVLLAVYQGWYVPGPQAAPPVPTSNLPTQEIEQSLNLNSGSSQLPGFIISNSEEGITRRTSLHTNIPTRPRTKIIEYTVTTGDSVFGIAQSFKLHPETVLWATSDHLNDSPDMLDPGMKLSVPPVDGVYYQWQESDSLESVAAKFDAKVQDILNWEGNNFDLTAPQVEAGQWIMIPNGHREFRQWRVPPTPGRDSGVSTCVPGRGA